MEISENIQGLMGSLRRIVLFLSIIPLSLFFSCEDQEIRAGRLEEEYSLLFQVDADSFHLRPERNLIFQDGLNLSLAARNRRALELFKQGEEDMAFYYLRESEEKNPSYFGTYFTRANLYIHKKEWAAALENYNALISRVPLMARFYYNRGIILQKLDRSGEALQDYLKALSLNAFYPEAAGRAGEIYFDRKDYESARSYYTRAISSTAPVVEDMEYRMATLKVNLGRNSPKEKKTRLRELDRRNFLAGLHLGRGRAFLGMQEYEEGTRDFTRALELNNTRKWAYYYRAISFTKQHLWVKTLEDLEECEFYFPRDPSVIALQAEASYFLKDEGKCRERMEQLNREFPTYVGGTNRDLYEKEFTDRYFYNSHAPLNLLLIGDSMAGGALRISMKEAAETFESIAFSWHYKVSSGLANIGFYNWQEVLEKLLSEAHYDLILIIMGTNDGQSFTYKRVRQPFRAPGWREVYKARALKFVGTLADHAVKTYWIGMPPMNDDYFQGKMVYLNDIFREVCAARENVDFIDTYPVLGGEKGEFRKYVTVNGEPQLARFSDDIHFRVEGIKPLTQYLFDLILRDFYIPG